MAKFNPSEVPPGETKRICDMTVMEYRSFISRLGGRSKSSKKAVSGRRGAITTKRFMRNVARMIKYPGRYLKPADNICLEHILMDLDRDPERAARLLRFARNKLKGQE